MQRLTQLGTNLFLGSTYSIVIYVDENDQTWVHHHTDKSRAYRSDWSAQKIAEALGGVKTLDDQLEKARNAGRTEGKRAANWEHNKLPWYKRLKKK